MPFEERPTFAKDKCRDAADRCTHSGQGRMTGPYARGTRKQFVFSAHECFLPAAACLFGHLDQQFERPLIMFSKFKKCMYEIFDTMVLEDNKASLCILCRSEWENVA